MRKSVLPIRTFLMALIVLVISCSDDKSSNSTPSGPRVDVTTVFLSEYYEVLFFRPDWSPDGMNIVYSGGPVGDVWRVAAGVGALPIPVTDHESDGLGYDGWTPGYLEDGRIVYYDGWIPDDMDNMHLMAAGPTQIDGNPASTVLQTFNGTHIGIAPTSTISPSHLSVSGDGQRAVGRWNDVYTLDWSSGPVISANLTTTIGSAVFCTISRDGTRIVYQAPGSVITWVPFGGGEPTVIGSGRCPTWNGDGTLLGFSNSSATAYIVHNIATGVSKTYTMPSGMELSLPVLSWDGTKVAFRAASGDTATGIRFGQLVDVE